jgi:tellurite resistance protein
MELLNDELGNLFAQALSVIARVDGEINPEEASRLRELVAKRTPVAIDDEGSFFHQLTADELAAAVHRAKVPPRELGRAFVSDAVALATADGDLNSHEAQAILRFARALGCTAEDVTAETDELDEWLHALG